MLWIQTVCKTIRNEKGVIGAYILNTVVLIVIYNLMLSHISLLYPLCISSVILLIYLVIRAFRLTEFEQNLSSAKLSGETDVPYGLPIEINVFYTISEIHERYNAQIYVLREQLNNRNTLFSRFIHNMKSSSAIIELACDKNAEDEVIRDISLENEKLKINLEQALNILRLDEFANDYVPERIDLLEMMNTVINDNKRNFIYAGVFPKVSGQSTYVYTDKKWTSYILEQLLSNAIKYSNSGSSIYFEITTENENAILSIRDDGIGISQEDLPRVFDLFFTGSNGRDSKEATGIGLAMVKLIAKQLGHKVSIESEYGCGTTAIVSFVTKTKG